MAALQIRLDEDLKEKAQAVTADMGMELSSAIRVFLAQMVKENGLPFRPINDRKSYFLLSVWRRYMPQAPTSKPITTTDVIAILNVIWKLRFLRKH